jgi:hypothetical protein
MLEEEDSDSENDFNDDEGNLGAQGEFHDSDEYLEEGSTEDSENESTEGAVIQRLKHDLFAEEADEKYDGNTQVVK